VQLFLQPQQPPVSPYLGRQPSVRSVRQLLTSLPLDSPSGAVNSAWPSYAPLASTAAIMSCKRIVASRRLSVVRAHARQCSSEVHPCNKHNDSKGAHGEGDGGAVGAQEHLAAVVAV
jgi:hypothetical protein